MTLPPLCDGDAFSLFGGSVADYIKAKDDTDAYAELVLSLARKRRTLQLSYVDVGQRMGVAPSTVARIERVGGDATVSMLQRYARAVDLKLFLVVEKDRSL